MVAFQDNIICGRFFIKFPTKFLKIIWGRSKSSFKKTILEDDFLRKSCRRTRNSWPNFYKIILSRSKLSFKKTITACIFSRRPSFLMGIFFYECHYPMTDSVSFRNESHRLIFDLWVINHRQNYRFEMIAPLSLQNDGLALSSRWWWTVSSKWWSTVTSRWLMIRSSKDWWLSLRYEDDALFERKGFEALCLLSKWQSFLLS